MGRPSEWNGFRIQAKRPCLLETGMTNHHVQQGNPIFFADYPIGFANDLPITVSAKKFHNRRFQQDRDRDEFAVQVPISDKRRCERPERLSRAQDR
jgi:hypothetical protein